MPGLVSQDRFRKWFFENSDGKWYLVGSEFGDAADLPAKYAWDKYPSIPESEISPEMKGFVSGFDGTSEKVEAALAKYAQGVDTDMGYVALDDPSVVAKEEKDGRVYYTLKCKAGIGINTYVIGWEGSKIVSIGDVDLEKIQKELPKKEKPGEE
jgi:hypothetical protein